MLARHGSLTFITAIFSLVSPAGACAQCLHACASGMPVPVAGTPAPAAPRRHRPSKQLAVPLAPKLSTTPPTCPLPPPLPCPQVVLASVHANNCWTYLDGALGIAPVQVGYRAFKGAAHLLQSQFVLQAQHVNMPCHTMPRLARAPAARTTAPRKHAPSPEVGPLCSRTVPRRAAGAVAADGCAGGLPHAPALANPGRPGNLETGVQLDAGGPAGGHSCARRPAARRRRRRRRGAAAPAAGASVRGPPLDAGHRRKGGPSGQAEARQGPTPAWGLHRKPVRPFF